MTPTIDLNCKSTAEPTVVVLAKAPRPGHSKTRLCPPCTPEQAAALAEAALIDTLGAVLATPMSTRPLLALDGLPGAWLPAGFDLIAQPQASLDVRIAAALDHVPGPALLVGMDTPQLTPAQLRAAADTLMLGEVDAVLGAAPDGGYWAIGLRRGLAAGPALDGIPMSVPDTVAAQRRRFRELGLCWREIPELVDVDTWEDALAVAALAPGTGFAAAVESVRTQITLAPAPLRGQRQLSPAGA